MLFVGQWVKCNGWNPKRGIPQWMSGKVCVITKVGRTRVEVRTSGKVLMSVPKDMIDQSPRCVRCAKPAAVDFGDGSGIFSSECLEKRCRIKR